MDQNEINMTVARALFKNNEIEKALEVLDQLVVGEVDKKDAFLLRGHIYYKMQQWGNAMNDYASVLELDPDNAEASAGIEMVNSILGYFTPDMFNP